MDGDERALMMRTAVDVVIIGATPAGLTAAQIAASAGYEVLVLEPRFNEVDTARCTGVVGLETIDEFDLPRHIILNVARSVVFRANGAEPVILDSERVHAAIIDRTALATALAARAEAAGVSLGPGVTVGRIEIQPGQVIFEADGHEGPISARACILACEAGFRFHQGLGLSAPRRFVQTAQVEIPFPSTPHIEVQFDKDLAPGGFAWCLPFSRDGATFARLGIICRNAAPQRCQSYVAKTAKERGIDPVLPALRPRLLPLVPAANTYADRVLAVGDAAGLVKPVTGSGVQYGLLTGRWAGQMLAEALRRDCLKRDDLWSYQEEWNRRLGPEIRAGLAFRTIAAQLDDRTIASILDLVRTGRLVPLLKATTDLQRVVLESLVA